MSAKKISIIPRAHRSGWVRKMLSSRLGASCHNLIGLSNCHHEVQFSHLNTFDLLASYSTMGEPTTLSYSHQNVVWSCIIDAMLSADVLAILAPRVKATDLPFLEPISRV